MELRHLRYFTTAVLEGSVTKAAKRLNIAQPPLSRQLKQLEEEVGIPLLEPGSRPLRTTDAGRFFHEQALAILDRAEALLMMTRRVGLIGKERFGIGFVGSNSLRHFARDAAAISYAYTAIRMDMIELSSVQQVGALKEGLIDIGFGRLHVDDTAVRREILLEEPLVAALPIGHPLLEHAGRSRSKQLFPTN